MSPELSTPTIESATRANRSMVRRVKRQIWKKVKDIEADIDTDIDICVRPTNELRQAERDNRERYGYGALGRAFIPRSRLYLVRTEESVGLLYGSSNGLEYRSHRFIFDAGGGISYHREPFGVDHQALPSQRLNLNGDTAIAAHSVALQELTWLSIAIGDTSPDVWDKGAKVAIANC